MFKLEFDIEKSDEKECKGLFFRGFNNTYFSRGDITKTQGIRFLKKMSCSGCIKCGFHKENLPEALSTGSLILPEIKHGALYTVRIINESTDWETGYVDDYDTEIIEVEE